MTGRRRAGPEREPRQEPEVRLPFAREGDDDLLHGDSGRPEDKSQAGDDREDGQRFERHPAAGQEEGRQGIDVP